MPAQLSYPGVYLQEVRGGDRAITGVATAVTAFVGRTRQGPVGVAVRVHSIGEFERVFGGLWDRSGLSYAVRDYYLNGGQDAVIVRLFSLEQESGLDAPAGGTANHTGVADVDISDVLTVRAVGPGTWANTLSVRITNMTPAAVLAKRRADLATAAVDNADKAAKAAKAEADAATKAAKKANEDAQAEGATDAVKAEAEALTRVAETKTADARRALEAKQAASDDSAAAEAALAAAVRNAATIADHVAAAQKQGVVAEDLFQLDLVDLPPTDGTGQPSEPVRTLESYANVTLTNGPRRIDLVVQTSDRIRAVLTTPADPESPIPPPVPGDYPLAGGGDGGVLDAQAYGVSAEFVPALQGAGEVSLLCLPPSDPAGVVEGVWAAAAAFCAREDVFLLIDAPPTTAAHTPAAIAAAVRALNMGPVLGRNAAVYFPRLRYADPLREGAVGEFAPCGAVAGIMARTDSARGVWKAPAGIEATLVGVSGLAVELTDAQNGELNPLAINCLRTLPAIGSVVWGARTMAGADALADEYKYIPVRRLALFLKESLYRGTQWVVFEPNDAGLWSQIRTTLGAFMQDLFKQGAFQGSSPREAYFVKCDAETTTQFDIDRGIVNIQVGFAPLKPAEFVVISIQQKTAAA